MMHLKLSLHHRYYHIGMNEQKCIHTSQIGNTLGVYFKLVTFQMLADERQKCVKYADCSCNCGGGWMPIT